MNTENETEALKPMCGLIHKIRKVADEMDEVAEMLKLAESRFGLSGGLTKGGEMSGAAEIAREWAYEITKLTK